MIECKFPLRVVKIGNDEPSSLLESRRDSRQLPEALMLAADEYKIWDTEGSWSFQSPSGLLLNTLSVREHSVYMILEVDVEDEKQQFLGKLVRDNNGWR